jgi:uncharacterized pyridoxamine 5'-phosphate oxidase family protein
VTTSFAAFEANFLRLMTETVWCTVTTVDARGRPRSRILHPIFEVREGLPVGWVVTGRTPVKVGHLAANPHVACSYWSPAQSTLIVDCVASWVEDLETKQHVFDLFHTTPPPVGYDLSAIGAAESELFTPLRLDPWRVQVMVFEGWDKSLAPTTWRRQGISRETTPLTTRGCTCSVYVQSRGAERRRGSPPDADTGRAANCGVVARNRTAEGSTREPRPLRGVDVGKRPVAGSLTRSPARRGFYIFLF